MAGVKSIHYHHPLPVDINLEETEGVDHSTNNH